MYTVHARSKTCPCVPPRTLPRVLKGGDKPVSPSLLHLVLKDLALYSRIFGRAPDLL